MLLTSNDGKLPEIAQKRPNVVLLEHKTLSPKNQNILFFLIHKKKFVVAIAKKYLFMLLDIRC